ncbi:MAG: phytoene/squalene synthase family protein [Bacteroidetes bacterium]|nr:phytoene/squalene synthase family protein [Bacteroidota bacterium]
MKDLYNEVCYKCSKLVTNNYSTSFSLGVSLLHRDFILPIHAIYGFVRFADEIVDSFHTHNKKELLERFIKETHDAIDQKISLNPILHSFQDTVNKYNIDITLIDTFLKSMQMDLAGTSYNKEGYEEYILGSAEVVGLMCLKIFVDGNQQQYLELKHDAMKLGSAFQKIYFLRDLKSDYHTLGRAYFPGFELEKFNAGTKKEIEADIQKDFDAGLRGIKKLPKKARLGVYLAYIYYLSLFKKIQNTAPEEVINTRIRINDSKKYMLLLGSYLKYNFNLI